MKSNILNIIFITCCLVLGATAYVWLVTNLLELSGLAVSLLRGAMGFAMLFGAIKLAGRGDDTLDQIKQGNTAAGLELVAYSLVVLGAMMSS